MFSKKQQTKKVSRKKLVKKLDDIVRVICRKRDTNCCSCGKPLGRDAQVSHYVSRRSYALRWNLKNCHMSCSGCNLLHNRDPLPYTQFMVRTYSDQILEYFAEEKKKVGIKTDQLQKMLEYLQELSNTQETSIYDNMR